MRRPVPQRFRKSNVLIIEKCRIGGYTETSTFCNTIPTGGSKRSLRTPRTGVSNDDRQGCSPLISVHRAADNESELTCSVRATLRRIRIICASAGSRCVRFAASRRRGVQSSRLIGANRPPKKRRHLRGDAVHESETTQGRSATTRVIASLPGLLITPGVVELQTPAGRSTPAVVVHARTSRATDL